MNIKYGFSIILFFALGSMLFAQDRVPLTTKSAEARELYEEAMVNVENVLRSPAIEKFAAATKADPNFAMAHAGLLLVTRDPDVERRHIARAKALRARTTPGEQLFITWATAQKESDLITAIAAMNDFIAKFPRDKGSLYFFARWLYGDGNRERLIALIENYILKVDPDYVPALNLLGYAYAETGQYYKGIAALRRTTELRPNEPNPYDSLADVLSQSGRFEEALAQYKRANAIREDFSTFGIAETMALMGRHQEARAEYTRGASARIAVRTAFEFAFQSAITYIRERDYSAADHAFSSLALEAHATGNAATEARAYRAMAMYARNPEESLALLTRAESALQHAHSISPTVYQQETARLLRLRAISLRRAGHSPGAGAALRRLADMTVNSRDSVVWRAYHAAQGSIFLADGKFTEAIAELEEDRHNALSRHELFLALERSGDIVAAKRERASLLAEYQSSIEDAIIRSRLADADNDFETKSNASTSVPSVTRQKRD